MAKITKREKLPTEVEGNPLKELFGFGKERKITENEFVETRKMLEPEF